MSAAKILVVDDSRAVRVSVQRVLEAAGYEVICAVDGNEAISRLDQNPHLMILDINMPGLDGYGVCEQLAAIGVDSQTLPIVFLTSNDSHAMELLGQQYGAYVHKTADGDQLLGVVADQLSTVSDSVSPNA